MRIVYSYIVATVIFFALDMAWLGLIAKNLYRQKLGFILSADVNWAAAIIFYLVYIAGIVYFAINPALKGTGWLTALLNGALLGGLCYATYDLTNMATIANWPLQIVVIDIAWGMVLTGGVSVITYAVISRFL
ncbi:MAG TPA: DUF2177 family protein [Chitinophagales bacterium]|nr:DUF2177 family protein [Chitinophagales bacterium]